MGGSFEGCLVYKNTSLLVYDIVSILVRFRFIKGLRTATVCFTLDELRRCVRLAYSSLDYTHSRTR